MRKQGNPIENKKGAAMVMVLCVMMVFLALSLSILLAASVMQGTANKAAISERCKTAALSFSQMVEKQLGGDESVISSNDPYSVKEMFKELILRGGAAGVYDPASDTNAPEMIKLACGMDGSPIGEELNGYQIEMQVYWEDNGANVADKVSNAVTDLEKEKAFSGVQLYMDVICRKGSEMYKIRSIYSVTVRESSTSPGSSEWSFQLGGRE